MLVLSKSEQEPGYAHLEADIGDCLLSIDELEQLRSAEFIADVAQMIRELVSQTRVRKPEESDE